MKNLTLAALLIFGLAVFAVGALAQEPKPATQPAAPASDPNMGTIRGKVIYTGTPPSLHPVDGTCCGRAQKNADDSFVLGSDKGLRDVVVSLKDAPAAPPGKPETIVLLDQKDCVYVPHVVALQAGETLRVTSSDPTEHNVHAICDDNPAFNFSQMQVGAKTDIVLAKPEVFPVKCDVHPWMLAYVHVMSHPYFAVTQADGTYEIRNVPPGNYTLLASHDRVGDIEQKITVAAGKMTTANIEYNGPQDK